MALGIARRMWVDGVRSPIAVAAEAGGGTFFQDTFTDTEGTALTSHTPNVGTSWTTYVDSGDGTNMIITTGQAAYGTVIGDGSYVIYKANGSPASAQYDISFKVTGDTVVATTGTWEVRARWNLSPSNVYRLTWAKADELVLMREYVSGTPASLGTSSLSFDGTASHTFLWHIRNADKNLYIDGSGSPAISSSNNNVTAAGDVGITIGFFGNRGILMFDDFLCVNYP